MEPKKLGRPTDQRLAVLYNQASELLWYGKIETTVDRAKSVRSIAEKILTLAINSYEDIATVNKEKVNLKGEKVNVEFTNDGPKKLAARRKMMEKLREIPVIKNKDESKAEFRARTADIKHPLVEKIFNEYAPKYADRIKEKGQGGGYTRILKIGKRRGDAADMCILQLI